MDAFTSLAWALSGTWEALRPARCAGAGIGRPCRDVLHGNLVRRYHQTRIDAAGRCALYGRPDGEP